MGLEMGLVTFSMSASLLMAGQAAQHVDPRLVARIQAAGTRPTGSGQSQVVRLDHLCLASPKWG